MKIQFILPLFTFFCLACGVPTTKALELQVESVSARPNESVILSITAAGYTDEQITAAAFTLTYDSQYLTLLRVDSDFFSTFEQQWNLLDPLPDPVPDNSVVVDGITYTQPVVHNTIDSSPLKQTLIAGVRVRSGTPSTLFTLEFAVAQNAPSKPYPISIQQSFIDNAEAGYDGGDYIPVLMGYDASQTDPALTYPVYTPDIISGNIIVDTVILDDDRDGIEDSWEASYFGNLTTADATSDYDRDGYTDLQEYLNSLLGDNDPIGAPYDPTVENAPNGTGYNPKKVTNTGWLMLLLD